MAIDLDYVVYYDPDREADLNFAIIEREVLAEIAPRHRVVRFEQLRAATLRSWSPFPTRTVEDDFLLRGFGRGPVMGLEEAQGPAVLRRRHDYLTHHQAQAESVVAMRCLGYVSRSVLESVQALVPRADRPRWLRGSIDQISSPICGRASRAAGDELNAPELPLTSDQGLLLACDAFSVLRIVHPAVSTTPDTVERMGRRDLWRWCGFDHDAVNARIRQELAEPDRHFGIAFDPCAAALWVAQNVMQLRVAAEEIDRCLKANNPASGGRASVDAKQDLDLKVRLLEDYGPPDLRSTSKKRKRRHILCATPAEKNCDVYKEPSIQPAGFPLRRRLLTAFYGGMSLPYDAFFAQEYAALESLARWIGRLRREGRAMIDRHVARDLQDIVNKSLLDLDRMLDAPDGAGAEALLVDLLPVEGWQALIQAADLIVAGERESFAISYRLLEPADGGPAGQVDAEAGTVAILGPFLMLPLHAADLWRERARLILPKGLYLT